MMLQLAERFLKGARDQLHTNEVERWMHAVRARFEQFSVRLAEYETLLFTAVGRKPEFCKAVPFFESYAFPQGSTTVIS